MTDIDLTSAPDAPDTSSEQAPDGTLESLPRRVALTLTELQHLAELAGGAPLPFDVTAPRQDTLADRLGASGSEADEAYAAALAALHDPADALARRGLITDGVPDAPLAGALGLLATPVLAVDIDVAVGTRRARAWHRHASDAVATLATSDGLVFELAWFSPTQWAAELAGIAALPEDVTPAPSAVPDVIDLPYELLDGYGEAVRSQRTDVLPALVAAHTGQVLDGAGNALDAAVVGPLVAGIVSETHGRLRALAADVSQDGAPVVGVVSWVLLADGWRSLRAHQRGRERRLEVRRVEPTDLASLLAPVLAEVSA